MIAIFGGGEIAEKGIVPVVGDCEIVHGVDVCEPFDTRMYFQDKRNRPPGGADAVIFTAGISAPASVAESDPNQWIDEVAANLVGAYLIARESVRAGVKTLVFIASLAGLYGKPNHSGYSASKAGLISLVQSLAMEGHNAYAISPGRVNTGMRERDYPGEDPRTRLDPLVIGEIVRDILAGKYTSGDNIVIRMRGHEMLPIEVHRGDGWREKLRVGEPPTC